MGAGSLAAGLEAETTRQCFRWTPCRLRWRQRKRLCKLGGMPWRYGRCYGATAPSLFHRGRRGGTLAAENRLHTAQPSLSRQIRDLEYEVGVQLMSRSVHGIELTAAGRAFLDHARLALTQAEAAAEAARRAAQHVNA